MFQWSLFIPEYHALARWVIPIDTIEILFWLQLLSVLSYQSSKKAYDYVCIITTCYQLPPDIIKDNKTTLGCISGLGRRSPGHGSVSCWDTSSHCSCGEMVGVTRAGQKQTPVAGIGDGSLLAGERLKAEYVSKLQIWAAYLLPWYSNWPWKWLRVTPYFL